MVRSLVLRGFDRQMAELIEQHLAFKGVRFLRPAAPARIEKLPSSTLVHLLSPIPHILAFKIILLQLVVFEFIMVSPRALPPSTRTLIPSCSPLVVRPLLPGLVLNE